jgi:zinc-ribbon domain
LSAQDQIALVFDLEVAVREGRSAAEMRDLLLSLRRRDDLLAKVGSRIDDTLKAVEAKGSSAATSQPRRVEEPTRCHQCRKPVDAGAKFCGNCGASIAAHAAPPPPSGPGAVPPPVLQPSAWKVANSQTRRYACERDDVPKLIVDVKNWLDTEGFDSQQMNTDDNGVLLQIKKRGSWRDFVGMATSLNIVFREADGLMNVEIGAGKWIDKAAVGTVSMFILWPLAVTAGFGAWEQMKMPDKIFGFIGNRLAYR